MPRDEIGLCGCSCGGCSGQRLACATCVDNTLRANGLSPEKYRDRIKDLEKMNRNSFEPWGCSAMAFELRKIQAEEDDKNGS